MKRQTLALLGATTAAVIVGFVIGGSVSTGAEAEAGASPVKALSEREVFYPGTEDLAPDEMRVVACGTGMPNARPKQAAACWLVELGNGDKFLFDIGTGSAERISAMKIPYDYLDKVFSSCSISAPGRPSGSRP
jgi:ribonuclease Z